MTVVQRESSKFFNDTMVVEELLQKDKQLIMGTNGFDIFISYRRSNGSEIAQLLHMALAARGFSVFLDVRDLQSGPFDEALATIIEASKDFVLILSEESLDRCRMPDDWLMFEIQHALLTGRNIIPVSTEDFIFPKALPSEIEQIRTHNCVRYTHDYCEASLVSLQSKLKSRPRLNVSRTVKLLLPHVAWSAVLLSTRIRNESGGLQNDKIRTIEDLAARQIIDRWASTIVHKQTNESVAPTISVEDLRRLCIALWNTFDDKGLLYRKDEFDYIADRSRNTMSKAILQVGFDAYTVLDRIWDQLSY